MSANQSKLISLLKYYWDNHWKDKNLMLILCGSIASFMVKKVLRSKALYGRFSLEINVQKLSAIEIKNFFPSKKNNNEILKYLLVLGGVPKYLEEINNKFSFEQNLERLFFSGNALFLEEFDKIFNVHFKKPKNYLNIIKAFEKKPLLLEDIAKSLKINSGGGLKAYLENLILAEFIRTTYSYLNKPNKLTRYKNADEFINFYTYFVLPNKKMIKAGNGINLLQNKISKQLPIWLGLAMENYVINNALYFANKLGFAKFVESFGSHYDKKNGVQFDLIYLRSDQTISICEIKHRNTMISTEIIPEFEAKIKKMKFAPKYSINKVLIAPNGVSEALIKSEYFDNILTVNDFFK